MMGIIWGRGRHVPLPCLQRLEDIVRVSSFYPVRMKQVTRPGSRPLCLLGHAAGLNVTFIYML